MKKEFLEYFQTIGIKGSILARIEELSKYVETLVPGFDFDDVVVIETVDKDGNRIYQHLRFISKDMAVSLTDFINRTEILVNRPRALAGITLKAKDFDFKHATEKSRLVILSASPPFNEESVLASGSGANCDHIMDLYHKYIFPRLKTEL